jgi:hypothetical protein
MKLLIKAFIATFLVLGGLAYLAYKFLEHAN